MSEHSVIRIEAAVYGEHEYYDEVVPQRKRPFKGSVIRTAPGSGRIGIRVVLSAVLGNDERITEGGCLGIGGRPKMRLSEVREHLDIGLGRNPKLHSPEPLGWGPLLRALEDSGVIVSEIELIKMPLEIHVSKAARYLLTLD
ncbi:MAG TPA: hypothetical protein VGF95_01945 [Solirubrobacteraceae bacterium]